MKTPVSELPAVVTRAEWLAARLELLTKEKELTRRRDALNAERRRLPMVRIDLTALGRQEDWEEPKGRTTGLGATAGSDKILYPDGSTAGI